MMTHDKTGKETELKLAIESKADLEKMRQLVGGEGRAPVVQENHFFDRADGVLDRERYACRVRREGDAYVVTVKGPSSTAEGGLLTERAEEEREVSAADAMAMLEGRQSPLSAFSASSRPAVVERVSQLLGGQPVVYVGGFKNLRTRVDSQLAVGGRKTDLVFEFDETTFPGPRVNYELEVEVPAGVDAALVRVALDDLCRRVGVTPRAASSKLKRFMAAISARP